MKFYNRLTQAMLRRPVELAQRASDDYQDLLAAHGIVGSMSRRGNCWDNAVAESFFATLKVELVHDVTWATRAVATDEIFEYMEKFYNGWRRHSSLGYLSPLAFERRRVLETLTPLSSVYGIGATSLGSPAPPA